MDEGVGMKELGGAGGEEGFFFVTATGFGSGESEDGAQALAASEDGIAHGFVDFCRGREVGGEVGVEVGVDEVPLLSKIAFEFFAWHDAERVGRVVGRIKAGLCLLLFLGF